MDLKAQIWIKLLIETGSYIDYANEDGFWNGYLVYENDKSSGLKKYAGFTNFYVFNLSISKCRHRLCQTYLLPSYQRQGLGYLMLEVSSPISNAKFLILV
jgi:GNAT superfamily N-acetyltransferase